MKVYIENLTDTRALELFENGGSKNIAENFLAESGFLEKMDFSENGQAVVATEECFLAWQKCLDIEQENIDMIANYTARTNDTLSESTKQALADKYKNNTIRDFAIMGDIEVAIKSKQRTLRRLFNSKLVVSKPVNKKFWPLTNTSHTFKIKDFKEHNDYKNGQWWRVSSEIDFELINGEPNNCGHFTVESSADMMFSDGKLIVTHSHHFWSSPLTVSQENEARAIIESAIYAEFAMRGISEEFAA